MSAICVCEQARADEPANLGAYSPYEKQAIARELARRGLEIESEPEGKWISSIDVASLDVFDETDPVPDFVNVFHATTRPRVILRECLFRVGDPFSQRRIDETARNLRTLPQLSLVLIVPVRERASDRVRVLVITKDVWSLRLNWNAQVGPDGLTYLLLNPSERNVLGTHATVGGVFELRRSTYSLGGSASHARVLGTRLQGLVSASIVFNRVSNRSEGSFGSFSYGLPHFSETQRWAYGSELAWDDGISRFGVAIPNQAFPLELSAPARILAQPTQLAYHRERYQETSSLTRSFGVRHKFDLSVGAEADRRVYRSLVPAYTEQNLRTSFENNDIPVSDTRIGPFVQARLYDNEFLKTIELETLGLQEDFRLGPELIAKAYTGGHHFGSSRDLLGIWAGLSYTFRVGDGLVRAIVTSQSEFANAAQNQKMLAGTLRVASPRTGAGRLIVDSVLEDRYQNYLKSKSSLGGDGRLRGYASSDTEAVGSGQLRGGDAFVSNVEWRTPGIDILTAQTGMAAFYDVGGAADRLRSLELRHSVGLGVRILFPELDRIVLRADWAFPLSAGARTFPGALFVTFGQAFLMPQVDACMSCTTLPGVAPYGLSDTPW